MVLVVPQNKYELEGLGIVVFVTCKPGYQWNEYEVSVTTLLEYKRFAFSFYILLQGIFELFFCPINSQAPSGMDTIKRNIV